MTFNCLLLRAIDFELEVRRTANFMQTTNSSCHLFVLSGVSAGQMLPRLLSLLPLDGPAKEEVKVHVFSGIDQLTSVQSTHSVQSTAVPTTAIQQQFSSQK